MTNQADYPVYRNVKIIESTRHRIHTLDKESEQTKEDVQKNGTKEISIFGIKMSYGKAFGITFLVLFVLLFFPGIGVSSASINKAKAKKDQKDI